MPKRPDLLRAARALAIATMAFLGVCQAGAGETDWGRALADATLRQNPSAAEVPWRYPRALFMLGLHRLHERTGDGRYLRYVEDWGDAHVDEAGNMHFDGGRTQPVPLPSDLDHLLAGRIAILLHQETGKAKFRLAADKLRRALDTWPRTSDGGLWHKVKEPDQLWLDGTYMVLPFLVEHGAAFGDSTHANQEAAAQLLIHARHLRDPATGLLHHAYDERGAARWADPATRRSPAFWCRSIGWYGMALVDVLDQLPVDHPQRPSLLAVLASLAAALEKYQDPKTGLWFQVVDQGTLPTNWTETSCSAMHAYTLSRAVEHGYVAASYQEVASLAYRGVLATLSPGADGSPNLAGIVAGTNPGDLAHYLARPRETNNWHGLGAFMLMHEQFSKAMAPLAASEVGRRFPAERQVLVDRTTGAVLTALTSAASNDVKIYQTHPQWTADGVHVIFASRDRSQDGQAQV